MRREVKHSLVLTLQGPRAPVRGWRVLLGQYRPVPGSISLLSCSLSHWGSLSHYGCLSVTILLASSPTSPCPFSSLLAHLLPLPLTPATTNFRLFNASGSGTLPPQGLCNCSFAPDSDRAQSLPGLNSWLICYLLRDPVYLKWHFLAFPMPFPLLYSTHSSYHLLIF